MGGGGGGGGGKGGTAKCLDSVQFLMLELWNPGFWSMHVFNYHQFVDDFSPL